MPKSVKQLFLVGVTETTRAETITTSTTATATTMATSTTVTTSTTTTTTITTTTTTITTAAEAGVDTGKLAVIYYINIEQH